MTYTALVFGGTGLVGQALLGLLTQDNRYKTVRAFVRAQPAQPAEGVEYIVVDFDNPESYAPLVAGDHVFICLGTTIGKAGSKKEFYKVDHDYIVEAATAAAHNGVKTLCLVSAVGTDETSRFFYPRVKGETERHVSALPFDAVHIVRPALLLGKRKEFRAGERLAVLLSETFPWLYSGPFRKYKAIADSTVARAMLRLAWSDEKGVHIYESHALHALGFPSK